MSKKTHFLVKGKDHRESGQTDFEYEHTAICGYVRDKVSREFGDINCTLCLNQLNKQIGVF